MKRLNQFILITSFIPFCWLAFMAIHELGHVIAGLTTGGAITKVVLHPLAISRTDVSLNPSPLVTVWAGPVIGVVVPLIVWGLFRKFRIPGDNLARFLAGFCMIANGA
ncbi:M50 family metallopeptidase [Thalassoglobus sp. JC818]|uniref:M50 family metallopeptidase n=1 Tax=Thalassoglobus sp. JC818 TaxID=3232136 RepID=UPI003458FCED